jgi:hypothetical protein
VKDDKAALVQGVKGNNSRVFIFFKEWRIHLAMKFKLLTECKREAGIA